MPPMPPIGILLRDYDSNVVLRVWVGLFEGERHTLARTLG